VPEGEATTNMGERRNDGRHEADGLSYSTKRLIRFLAGNEIH
jgi:hypothetical protein